MKRSGLKKINKGEKPSNHASAEPCSRKLSWRERILYTAAVILFLGSVSGLKAQILNVGEFIQEQDQWCWSGVSECVLDYHCAPKAQCEIAEYTREVATWHDFGSTDCCINPGLGCNYWNYNWGVPGSIQDILIHFASIDNPGISTYLDTAQIHTRIKGNRLFIFRWGWTTGGGHFLVGHGLVNMNMYYMNPWFGEGFTISDYDWVVSNPDHTWTHTNDITTPSPKPFPVLSLSGPTLVVRGSTGVNFTTPVLTNAASYLWEVSPASAGSVVTGGTTGVLNLTENFTGLIYMKVKGHNSCGDGASDSLAVNVYDPSFIGYLTGEDGIRVYPVPSTGLVHIDCDQPDPGRWLEVLSLTGQQVKKIPVTGKQSTLDLSGQTKGIYFGRITGTPRLIKLVLE
ncbi:MAG: T9SS type A sorting domain-containing protein [Bacteroidetes bacterium]|nr:T9SS type A sorting domain-containing protein [Bacteroidota bacterium]